MTEIADMQRQYAQLEASRSARDAARTGRTVRRVLVTAALIAGAVLLSNRCHAAEWDTTDKVLFGSFVALQAVDVAQTNYVRHHQDRFREVNSLYGNPPDMGRVIAFKALIVGGTYWLVRDADSSTRKLALGVATALSLSIVGHNASLGVGFSF